MKVFLLHGGIFSTDGIVTSVGMNGLASMLRRLPGVGDVRTYLWGNWRTTYNDIMALDPKEKVVVIGYSGGGVKATWVANGWFGSGSYPKDASPRPRIDLMVLYDPSPKWAMMPVGENVARAICYHNASPLMFGLGGGVLTGAHVESFDIHEQHLAVQFDQGLHGRTVVYVEQCLGQI